MRKGLIILVFFAVFLSGSAALAGSDFSVSAAGDISGYQNNPINVSSPEEGNIIIEISDDTTLYRRIEKDVPAGKSQIIWDGLGWNEERMAQKEYTLTASLLGVSGAKYFMETRIRVVPAQQAMLFALPSDPAVYLNSASDWFMEFKMLYTDLLVVEFFDQETDTLVMQTNREMKGARVNRISWNTLTGKRSIAPGSYRVRVYGQRHPSCSKEFSLIVQDGTRPVLPLAVTGDIMPSRESSDAEIWEKMIAPAVVVDLKNTSHQKVYASPDRSDTVIGTLHGQSQTLSVLELQEGWALIEAWTHEDGSPVKGWVPSKVLKVVQPQTEYGLLVDKRSQTLTLFHQGERVDTLLVSTGRMEKGQLYQETAAGSFLTDEHMSDYSTNGLKYDFVIRYDGGNLLHQIPYSWNETGKKDMIPGEIVLGTKASHACIRIQQEPGASGLNAYWFWTHLPYHTRVIVLDDPEERENRYRVVTGNTPDLMEGLQNAWQVESDSEESESVRITFGGDAVLGARESYYGLTESLPAYLESYGMDWPFARLQSLFQNDDLTVINLEGVLKEDGSGEDLTKQWRFRGLPEYAKILPMSGVELVNIANNHTIDYGEAGYSSTLQTLESYGISYCGNGNNLVISIKGVSFGFGGCRETTYRQDPDMIARDIADLKNQGAEFIIYQCHWGTEYDANHNVLQEAMARACQRAGADLVIGHHTHCVQGIDFIQGMPVVYSLGNLCFGGTIKLTTYDAMLVQADFYPERSENRVELRLIPILTSGEASNKINNYQPVTARNEDALRILNQVQQDTGFLLTEKVKLDY